MRPWSIVHSAFFHPKNKGFVQYYNSIFGNNITTITGQIPISMEWFFQWLEASGKNDYIIKIDKYDNMKFEKLHFQKINNEWIINNNIFGVIETHKYSTYFVCGHVYEIKNKEISGYLAKILNMNQDPRLIISLPFINPDEIKNPGSVNVDLLINSNENIENIIKKYKDNFPVLIFPVDIHYMAVILGIEYYSSNENYITIKMKTNLFTHAIYYNTIGKNYDIVDKYINDSCKFYDFLQDWNIEYRGHTVTNVVNDVKKKIAGHQWPYKDYTINE